LKYKTQPLLPQEEEKKEGDDDDEQKEKEVKRKRFDVCVLCLSSF